MHSKFGRSLNLGVILCKHCGEMIDTLDTDRVITYYGECDHEQCKQSACMKREEAEQAATRPQIIKTA